MEGKTKSIHLMVIKGEKRQETVESYDLPPSKRIWNVKVGNFNVG